jgi:hypothetical protein
VVVLSWLWSCSCSLSCNFVLPFFHFLSLAGERTVFWMQENGTVTSSKRFECEISTCTPYRFGANQVDMMVATHDDTLHILRNDKIMWATHTSCVPVALRVAAFDQHLGMIVGLEDTGRLNVYVSPHACTSPTCTSPTCTSHTCTSPTCTSHTCTSHTPHTRAPRTRAPRTRAPALVVFFALRFSTVSCIRHYDPTSQIDESTLGICNNHSLHSPPTTAKLQVLPRHRPSDARCPHDRGTCVVWCGVVCWCCLVLVL